MELASHVKELTIYYKGNKDFVKVAIDYIDIQKNYSKSNVWSEWEAQKAGSVIEEDNSGMDYIDQIETV